MNNNACVGVVDWSCVLGRKGAAVPLLWGRTAMGKNGTSIISPGPGSATFTKHQLARGYLG